MMKKKDWFNLPRRHVPFLLEEYSGEQNDRPRQYYGGLDAGQSGKYVLFLMSSVCVSSHVSLIIDGLMSGTRVAGDPCYRMVSL